MTGNLKQVETVFSRFGSMINTILIIVSAIGLVYAWGQYDAGVKSDIARIEKEVNDNAADFEAYTMRHEALVKERFGDNRALAASTDSRIDAVEKLNEEAARKADRIEYRITVAESAITTQQKSTELLTDKINDLVGDVKVIKEVVVRTDRAQLKNGKEMQ